MAKWGEGDPRWIVEERPDATNVNNWHWTERNATPWSQEKIKELFKNLEIKSDVAKITITEIEKCEGEASANNRKGKLIFFYEWDIVLKWIGEFNSDLTYEGQVTIPNLSEENNISEVDITVTLKDSDETGEILKEFMHKTGREEIRKQLEQYVNSLKAEFSKGMILPKKDKQPKSDNITNLSSGFNKRINMSPAVESTNRDSGVKIDTTTIKIAEKFQCRAQEFYDAMTRIEMVTAFTQSPVKMEPVKGGQFSLFSGNISGVFEELEPAKRIVQKWRYKQWPEGHFSNVTIDIEEKSDHTEVKITQTGVPSNEADVTKVNWHRYYINAIKRTFGFGSFFT